MACVTNVYGIFCIIGIMSGRKLNYYCTLTAPVLFCWILYVFSAGAWTLMNITLMPSVCYGFWVNVGAAFLSLVMRYHLKMYYNELKKIRAFILLMS